MGRLTVAAVIPCFNASRFIDRTLRAVLDQGEALAQVITIDDGSEDGTHRILARHAPRVTVLSHPGGANLGHGATLNRGIDAASADVIAFCDADDIWYPDKVRRIVDTFESDPGIAAVYTNGDVIDENDRPLYPILPDGFEETNDPGRLLLDCYIRTPTMVAVRADHLRAVGPFRAGWVVDHDMWLRVMERARFAYLPERLVGYRRHAGQISLDRRQWEDAFQVLRSAVRRHRYPPSLLRRRLAVLYYRLGEHDRGAGKRLRSALYWALSGILDPVRALRHVFSVVR